MTNSPALPAGFEVESVGKSPEVSALPEGFEVESIPEEESLLRKTGRTIKGVLDIPERVTKEVILPFTENIATQAVGGAGAVVSPAVAVRNYLTTLAATGNLEKSYESASRGARETGEFFSGVAERIPTTELGKKSSEYVAKGFDAVLEPVGGIAREAIRVPLQSLEAAGLPRIVAKPIEDVTRVVSEFAVFGGLMKGGGKAKSIVRDIYNEKKGMPPTTPTAAQFEAAKSAPEAQAELRPLEVAKQEFAKPEVKAEYEEFLADVEGKGHASEEVILDDLAKREDVRAERKAWEDYERFPELPEGFEVESMPDVSVADRSSYVPSRDTRSAAGDVSKIDMQAEKELPFKFQNSNQEQVYKEFKNGQYYRYNALEGAGDVFRELALREEPDFGYISEKISHIENQIKQERRGIHPDDSFETSRRENQDAFKKLEDLWSKQPVTSETQKVAVELNKDMLRGDFTAAEKNIQKIKEYFEKPSERVDAGGEKSFKDYVKERGLELKDLDKDTLFTLRADYTKNVNGLDAEARAKAALDASTPKQVIEQKQGVFGKLGDKLKSEAGSVITAQKKPFYSKLEEVINRDMKMNMPVEQLRKMAYNKGVTVDEWNDAFRHLRGKVTKGQLLDELAVHGRKFEDVILGEKKVSKLDNTELIRIIKENDNFGYDTATEALRDLRTGELSIESVEWNNAVDKTKFRELIAEHQRLTNTNTPQFEQYSEPGYKPGSYRELFVTEPGKLKYSFDLHNRIASELNKIDISPENKLYRQQKQDILNKYGMTLEQWHEFKKFGWQDGHSAYSNIGNPIVRIRFNERDVNGKKVLFVEEIQGPSEANQAKMPESLRNRIYDIGVKRVVSYAKENGFDEIAWTTGKMQADRYSLEKHLDEVRASVLGDGYKIGLTDKKGNTYNYEEYVSAKELPEYVGKTLAKRIIEEAPLNPDGVTFTGLDLKVGGEGLKRLYDEVIPGLMEKYGGGKVKDSNLLGDESSLASYTEDSLLKSQRVKTLPLTEKSPSSFTMYSDPFGFQASAKALGKMVEEARDGWEQVLEKNPTIAKLDEKARTRLEEIYRGIKEGTLDPERIMREDPYANEIIKNLFAAEEAKNAFMQKVMPAFLEATKGIKKGSDSSARIGKVLDGQESVDILTAKERKAFDFFKENYDWMIHEYARNAAGSEANYRKVLNLVTNKQEKRSRVKDLNPEDRAEYDRLRQIATEIKGEKKITELDQNTRDAYERAAQQARDFLRNDFKKNMSEGERAAYDILSRKLTDYLPHLFDKKELKEMFESDLARIQKKLKGTTKKELITKYKNQIAEVERALANLEGGKWVNFRDLPKDVFFRFFTERKGAKGYSFDAVKAFESYVYGIARKIYDEPALRKSYEFYEKVGPELKPYTKELVNHYMGYEPKSYFNNFARFVTTYEWIRTLGLNPRSALVNLTQRLNTAVWVGEKYAVQAQKMMFLDKAKADALFDKSGVAREIPQVLMEGPVAPSLQGLRSVTGVLFDMVEKGNRQHAFLSGYLKAKAKGTSEDLAIKEGIKIVHKTQFRYGKLGMAKWSRGPGGRIALQFLSYPLKQAQFLYDLYKKDKLAFMRYAAYTIGGNLTLQELLDTDMSNAVGFGITFGEMLKAVQSASEGDMRGTGRHFMQAFSPGGGLLPAGLGPAASAVVKTGYASATKGKGTEQLIKEITPIMWTRLKQAYKGVKEGSGSEYPIFDDRGHKSYNLNARQLVQRTLGPRTDKERREGLVSREERNLEQERKEVTAEVAKRFADGILDGDETAIDDAADLMVKYGIDIDSQQLKNEIEARLLTREERVRPGKKEFYQLQREGETVRDKYSEEED